MFLPKLSKHQVPIGFIYSFFILAMAYSSGSQSVVCGPLGLPESLSEGLWGQIYFHNNTEKLFAFFITMLTFTLMVQKQR